MIMCSYEVSPNCQRQMCILRKGVVWDATVLAQLPETKTHGRVNPFQFGLHSKSWQMWW